MRWWDHLGLWRGRQRSRETKPVASELPKLRKLFFAGDLAEAGQQTMRLLSGQHRGLDPYQPFGELVLEFPLAEALVKQGQRDKKETKH